MRRKLDKTSFKSWLYSQTLEHVYAERVYHALRSADEFARSHHLLTTSIFAICNKGEAISAIESLQNNQEFISKNRYAVYVLKTLAIRYYVQYIEECNHSVVSEEKRGEPPTSNHSNTSVNVVSDNKSAKSKQKKGNDNLSVLEIYDLATWEFPAVSIDVFQLSSRTTNVLKRNDIFTISNLLCMKLKNLYSLSGLGYKSKLELEILFKQMQLGKICFNNTPKDADESLMFIKQYSPRVGLGENELNPEVLKALSDKQTLKLALGKELSEFCMSKPGYSMMIVRMFEQFIEEEV